MAKPVQFQTDNIRIGALDWAEKILSLEMWTIWVWPQEIQYTDRASAQMILVEHLQELKQYHEYLLLSMAT